MGLTKTNRPPINALHTGLDLVDVKTFLINSNTYYLNVKQPFFCLLQTAASSIMANIESGINGSRPYSDDQRKLGKKQHHHQRQGPSNPKGHKSKRPPHHMKHSSTEDELLNAYQLPMDSSLEGGMQTRNDQQHIRNENGAEIPSHIYMEVGHN